MSLAYFSKERKQGKDIIFMTNRQRITVDEVYKSQFYQMPKFLFQGEFESLSNDARVLYSLLKERHELSIKNKWVNNDGEVYLIMSREEMCSILGVSLKTVIKAVNQLLKFQLLEEERRGQGKPNLLFLLELENLQFQTCKISMSRPVISPCLDMENLQPNNTNKSKTNFSKKKINQSIKECIEKNEEDTPIMIETFEDVFKENIDYEILIERNPQSADMIDEFVSLISDAVGSTNETISIGGQAVSVVFAKKRLLQLDGTHIEYVLECLKNTPTKIVNIRAYLLAALFNAPTTIANYYQRE